MQQMYSREDVEQALRGVLADAKFAAAPQMSAFLKFVVIQTLDGNADRIKAYTVAVDALGKPTTFDPQNDPSVRVLAKRLRDTLKVYYDRTEGHKVELKLHCGSYVPEFRTYNQLDNSSTLEETNSTPTVVATSNVTPITATTESVDLTHNIRSNDSIFATDKLAKP